MIGTTFHMQPCEIPKCYSTCPDVYPYAINNGKQCCFGRKLRTERPEEVEIDWNKHLNGTKRTLTWRELMEVSCLTKFYKLNIKVLKGQKACSKCLVCMEDCSAEDCREDCIFDCTSNTEEFMAECRTMQPNNVGVALYYEFMHSHDYELNEASCAAVQNCTDPPCHSNVDAFQYKAFEFSHAPAEIELELCNKSCSAENSLCIYNTKDGDAVWDTDEWNCGLSNIIVTGEFGTDIESKEYTGVYNFTGNFDDSHRPTFQRWSGEQAGLKIEYGYHASRQRWAIYNSNDDRTFTKAFYYSRTLNPLQIGAEMYSKMTMAYKEKIDKDKDNPELHSSSATAYKKPNQKWKNCPERGRMDGGKAVTNYMINDLLEIDKGWQVKLIDEQSQGAARTRHSWSKVNHFVPNMIPSPRAKYMEQIGFKQWTEGCRNDQEQIIGVYNLEEPFLLVEEYKSNDMLMQRGSISNFLSWGRLSRIEVIPYFEDFEKYYTGEYVLDSIGPDKYPIYRRDVLSREDKILKQTYLYHLNVGILSIQTWVFGEHIGHIKAFRMPNFVEETVFFHPLHINPDGLWKVPETVQYRCRDTRLYEAFSQGGTRAGDSEAMVTSAVKKHAEYQVKMFSASKTVSKIVALYSPVKRGLSNWYNRHCINGNFDCGVNFNKSPGNNQCKATVNKYVESFCEDTATLGDSKCAECPNMHIIYCPHAYCAKGQRCGQRQIVRERECKKTNVNGEFSGYPSSNAKGKSWCQKQYEILMDKEYKEYEKVQMCLQPHNKQGRSPVINENTLKFTVFDVEAEFDKNIVFNSYFLENSKKSNFRIEL